MAMRNPVGRANYEPNSWGDDGGPRESRDGFSSYVESVQGETRRLRPESFADHYSQARQFYLSQTDIEKKHISDAFTFELSKVKTAAIRERMVASLVNVDKQLAQRIAGGLGMSKLPKALPAAAPVKSLDLSPALSILRNPPKTIAGRSIGVLVANGVDAKALLGLRRACKSKGVMVKIVAPSVMGIKDSDDNEISVDEQLQGGPSVLFDAIAILGSARDGGGFKVGDPGVKNFINDAHAHSKFVGYAKPCEALLAALGLDKEKRDDGYVALDGSQKAAEALLERLYEVRFWAR